MTHVQAGQGGQVLVFVALVLPIVLLPAAAFALDAATVSSSEARLQAATARAAESAAQRLDAGALRASDATALDPRSVERVATDVIGQDDPEATIQQVDVAGLYVTVETAERIVLPLNFLGSPAIELHARATARLTLGYESPSSFLPLSVNTF